MEEFTVSQGIKELHKSAKIGYVRAAILFHEVPHYLNSQTKSDSAAMCPNDAQLFRPSSF